MSEEGRLGVSLHIHTANPPRATKRPEGMYTSELRAFAFTLHFYSPSAFENVLIEAQYRALSAERTLLE